MELSVFAKKRNTQEGKIFYSYLTTMTKKDGTELTVSLKFRDECGSPKPDNCPLNIIVEKSDANLVSKDFTREETGETGKLYTLWISKWVEGAPYVDHSLDDFE